MSAPLLLDTCAALWAEGSDASLGPQAEQLIDATLEAGRLVYLSPITAWEVGQLVSKGRVALKLSPDVWFDTLLRQGFSLAPMTPEILVASSFLPESNLRDPADKILATTARTLGCRLMTRDRPLLDYAAAGWMQAVAC